MNLKQIIAIFETFEESQFRPFVSAWLRNRFSGNAQYRDGSGDLGVDWLVSTPNQCIAIQTTVQDDWLGKLKADARKIKDSKEVVTRFLFLTSKSHQKKEFLLAEQEVGEYLDIPVECIGARELANSVVGELEDVFLREFGAKLDGAPIEEHRYAESMLHTYFLMGEDIKDLKNSVVSASIRMELLVGEQTVEKLHQAVTNRLAEPHLTLRRLRRAIEKDVKSGVLTPVSLTKSVALTATYRNRLLAAVKMHEESIARLKRSIVSSLPTSLSKTDAKIIDKLVIKLAQLAVECQLESARKSLPLVATGFPFDYKGVSQDIKKTLSNLHVAKGTLDSVYETVVKNTASEPALTELATAVLYYKLGEVSTRKASLIFQADTWKDVSVLIDTSVAIPYLLSRMFHPVDSGLMGDAIDAVNRFKELGARLNIPSVYLNECASHLYMATRYLDFIDRGNLALSESENCFVSYYSELRRLSLYKKSFREFLTCLCSGLCLSADDSSDCVDMSTRALRKLLKAYQLNELRVGDFDASDRSFRKIKDEYDAHLRKEESRRDALLKEHDSTVLHYLRFAEQNGAMPIVVTADTRLISHGADKYKEEAFFIKPTAALDIFPYPPDLDSAKRLHAICNVGGALNAGKNRLAALIVDRLVRLSSLDNDADRISEMSVMLNKYSEKWANVSNNQLRDKRASFFRTLRRKGYIGVSNRK